MNNVTYFAYWMQQVASKSMTRLQARDLRWFSSASSVYIYQMILRQTKWSYQRYQSTILLYEFLGLLPPPIENKTPTVLWFWAIELTSNKKKSKRAACLRMPVIWEFERMNFQAHQQAKPNIVFLIILKDPSCAFCWQVIDIYAIYTHYTMFVFLFLSQHGNSQHHRSNRGKPLPRSSKCHLPSDPRCWWALPSNAPGSDMKLEGLGAGDDRPKAPSTEKLQLHHQWLNPN